MDPADEALASGLTALSRGDWAGARGHFDAALACRETAPALEGLGEALWWLDEVGAGLAQHRRAYALYREAGEACRAARVALWLARTYIGAYANAAVANGWLQRAERLVEEAGDCAERGWLEQLRSKMAGSAAAAADHAARAVEIARRHHAPTSRCGRSPSRDGPWSAWDGWTRAWPCWTRRWPRPPPGRRRACSW